jgi:hypothetical protein
MFCAPGFEFFNHQLKYSLYNYLEIGVFNGDSIGNLGREHTNHIIFGVDPFIEDGYTTDHTGVGKNEYANQQKANTVKNTQGLDNVIMFEMLSSEFADMLTDEMVADMNVAWVLIDGSHHYEDVAVDVKLAMRLIGDKPGGIVFDDVNLDGVGRAYREFLETYKAQVNVPQDIYATHPGHIIAHLINQ